MKTAIFARRACAFGLSAALVLACAPVYAFAGDAVDSHGSPIRVASSASSYSKTDAQKLVNNLAKRFMAGGTDASIDNNTAPAAYALSGAGMSGYIDVAAVKANLEKSKADEYFGVGTLAKYVLILQCAGADTSEYESQLAVQESIYSNVIILQAADSQNTELVSNLIDAIVADLDAETGLVVAYGSTDYQTSAQTLEALAPYVSTNATAKAAAEKLADSLTAAQQSTGAWQVQDWSTGAYKDDVDTTAEALVALSAYSNQSAFDKAAPSAIAYLLGCANDGFTGINESLVYSESMSAAIVLQALVAADITPKGIVKQTIKVSPASRTVKYKKVKKAKKTVSFKVKGAWGKLVTEAVGTKAQKALRVKANDNKVALTVKKGAKKGTYKVNVYAKASGAYKKSATKTLKVVVK